MRRGQIVRPESGAFCTRTHQASDRRLGAHHADSGAVPSGDE